MFCFRKSIFDFLKSDVQILLAVRLRSHRQGVMGFNKCNLVWNTPPKFTNMTGWKIQPWISRCIISYSKIGGIFQLVMLVNSGCNFSCRSGILGLRYATQLMVSKILTRVFGPPQGSVLEGKWDPLFQGIPDWWNIIIWPDSDSQYICPCMFFKITSEFNLETCQE